MFTPELIQEERKIQRTSAYRTAIIMVLLLGGSMIWWATRDRVPPPGEEYEVVGAIDFGDLKSGSKQVNNLERATEQPAEVPKPASKPVQAPPAETTPPKEEVITQEEPAPVETPKPEEPDPKPTPPKPVETVKPAPKPVEKTENNTENETSESQPEEKPQRKPLTDDFGSNQGNEENSVGNQGTPIKQLDPDGLFSFGQGIGGGSSERGILALPKPNYTSQEEGRLTFQFTIMPDGRVSAVRLQGLTDKLSLKQAGIAAIRQWKFTKLRPDQPQTPFTTTVTITFRLK